MPEPERTLQELLDVLTGRLSEPPNWTALLQLASETLTIGTLARVVLGSRLEPTLHPDVKALLRDVLERATARNERLLSQFFEILPLLNARGVQPIVMKGLASLLESGTGSGRLMADLDLLIPRHARELTSQALASIGYQTFQGRPPYPITMGRACDVGEVDLHTDIQPYFLQVDYDRVAALCSTVEVEGGSVLLPSPTGALLLYVLHDQLHDGDYWRGLIDARHFADIPRLVTEGVDWETLQEFFPRGCPRNALNVQLRTAKSLLNIDIPEEYCGGALARLQLLRRRLQLRFPALMRPFTFLSLALDPPKNWKNTSPRSRSTTRQLRTKAGHALSPANPGKVVLRSDL